MLKYSNELFKYSNETSTTGYTYITSSTIKTSSSSYILSWKPEVKLHNIALDFCTIGLLGFCLSSYVPISFEFAAELTYPESEGTDFEHF